MLEEKGRKRDARLLHVGQIVAGEGHLITCVPIGYEYLLMSRGKSKNAILAGIGAPPDNQIFRGIP